MNDQTTPLEPKPDEATIFNDAERKQLITVLRSLEEQGEKQLSLKRIFMRGVIYGLGTVIGATVLLSIVSYLMLALFGEQFEDKLQPAEQFLTQ